VYARTGLPGAAAQAAAMPIRSAVVADDEILNRELLAEMLPRFNVQVRTAKDGVQALKALETEPAELLITDVRMPGMGGLKLLGRAKEKWPDMPVVMMTAPRSPANSRSAPISTTSSTWRRPRPSPT
jgi:CheY-like chemotaxis protein